MTESVDLREAVAGLVNDGDGEELEILRGVRARTGASRQRPKS